MDTEAVLTLLQEVAAESITPRFRTLDRGDVGRKQLHAPVTVADREAEASITAALRQAYPRALVLGEEAVAAADGLLRGFREADHAFTVDPVDGTRQFVKGSPDHAVMVAELRGGEVVRSWIWQPQHRRAYVAERGAGAWFDGERMVRRTDGPAGSGGLGLWRLRRTGTCCGVDYPRTATGGADYATAWRPKPWDHAPGSLLLTECGGVVGALDGTAYRPQAAPPRVLLAAADRATYDRLRGVLGRLPGL